VAETVLGFEYGTMQAADVADLPPASSAGVPPPVQSPDVRRLVRAVHAPGFAYRELTVPPARRPAKGAGLAVLALVSFERESGRTTIARGLIPAFARRGLRAVRAHAPPAGIPARCDVLVVDEPGPPTFRLLAEADEILVVLRPSLEGIRAAEARLGPLRSYRRGAARYLASRVDARADVRALSAMRVLLGPRLLAATIHEDPFLDDPGSQVKADFASLARELRRRRR